MDFADGHETVLCILSSHYINMVQERGNTVAVNHILAQSEIPIPCFREHRLDILLLGEQMLIHFISALVS